MSNTEQSSAHPDFQFEQVYQGDSTQFGVPSPLRTPPWDIGAPQPLIVALHENGRLHSEVLDAGCGPGDNSIFLAERGYRVTGFDFAPSAIEQARERAATSGANPEFAVADATVLDGFQQRFQTVLDSALYHCLNDEQRADYAAALHRVALPGAELYLHCAADTDSAGVVMPMRVRQDNLRGILGEHWDIRSIEAGTYTTVFRREFLEQLDADSLAEMDMEVDFDTLRTDASGQVLIPIWQLHAVRR